MARRGYSVTFPEFDMGREYKASFQFSRFPTIGRKCGVYLAFHDPSNYFNAISKRERAKLLEATVRIELLDDSGQRAVDIEGKLQDFVWYGFKDLHALYLTDRSFFTPDTSREYLLRVRYRPDERLAQFRGFAYLECDGGK